MHIWALLSAFSLAICCTESLRFSHIPITLDSDVIVVNQPTKLTCNYVKFRTESVREISWYIGYAGFRSKVFHYHVTTGKKEDSTFAHVKTMGESATENELTVVLPELRGSPITIGCEVEVLRDNGYGKLAHNKKMEEVNVTVVDSQGHQMIVKKDKWNAIQNNDYEASVGQPLLVSCMSKGGNPSPNLTLTLNGTPWPEISSTARMQEIFADVPADIRVIEATLDAVYDSMFNQDGIMEIVCKATYQDFVMDKKPLGLKKKSQYIVQDEPRYSNHRYTTPHSAFEYSQPQYEPRPYERQGRIQHTDESHDADVILSRLLDLLDPKKHMHPGIPYDFYSGYILMAAKNVDTEENDATSTGSYYSGTRSTTPPMTYLYGRLPNEVVVDLQRNYGRFHKISDEQFKIAMNPVDALNILGNHGYRVIGFTAEADRKMVWTLEQKDFEQNLVTSEIGLSRPHF